MLAHLAFLAPLLLLSRVLVPVVRVVVAGPAAHVLVAAVALLDVDGLVPGLEDAHEALDLVEGGLLDLVLVELGHVVEQELDVGYLPLDQYVYLLLALLAVGPG